MNDRQIDAMVSDLVQHADYDLWKGFFSRHPEDPEMAEATREELREVARKHVNMAAAANKEGTSGSQAATLTKRPGKPKRPGCPKCRKQPPDAPVGGGPCCNPACNGTWGTGCFHCHHPRFLEER